MKQSDAQMLGRMGQRWFESQLPKEWVFQRPTEDFGIDGVVVIGEPGPLNGIEFKVQIKASRSWQRLDQALLLSGVKRRTVREWVVGLAPTMIALYEENTHTGYVYWVIDLFPGTAELRQLFTEATDTVTLKIPTELGINGECWEKVRARLAGNYEAIIDAFQAVRVNRDLLPLLHSLAESLRGLYFSRQNWQAADTSEKQGLLLLLETMSHRDAVTAITRFKAILPAEIMLTRNIDALLEFYHQKLGEFYLDFERLLAEPQESAAIRVNQEVLLRERPYMTIFLIGLISKFSGMLVTDAGCRSGETNPSFPFPWVSFFSDAQPSK